MNPAVARFARPLLRGLLRVHAGLLTLLKRRAPREPFPERGQDILLTGARDRPHIVGGFHLLINGLVAAVVARLVGARALHSCVVGLMEFIAGGIRAENRLARERMERYETGAVTCRWDLILARPSASPQAVAAGESPVR